MAINTNNIACGEGRCPEVNSGGGANGNGICTRGKGQCIMGGFNVASVFNGTA